jgi:hypothetical protein
MPEVRHTSRRTGSPQHSNLLFAVFFFVVCVCSKLSPILPSRQKAHICTCVSRSPNIRTED